MKETADYTSDLNILSQSRNVSFSDNVSERRITLVLHPFKFRNFKTVIDLVKKYWDCYLKVQEIRKEAIDNIIEETIEDKNSLRKKLLIENYDENFNEVGLLVNNIFQSDKDDLAQDVATLISFCLWEEYDLENLNIGEITVLLIAAIEINMDFFEQNL
ncbi:MAG: hypothetical protein AB4372_20355, partial [Xenococcus sp. (in: cyanobacteria)]